MLEQRLVESNMLHFLDATVVTIRTDGGHVDTQHGGSGVLWQSIARKYDHL
jgi:hypothetical protein